MKSDNRGNLTTQQGTEAYGFLIEFEHVVGFLCCTDPQFFGRVGHLLDPTGFVSDFARVTVDVSQQIFRENGTGPSDILVVIQRLKRIHDEGKMQWAALSQVADELDRLEEAGKIPKVEEVLAQVVPVIQRRMHADAIKKAMETFAKRGDMGKVAEMLVQASALGSPQDMSLRSMLSGSAFDQLDSLRMMERLPVGIPELDYFLGGGLARRQFGFFLGSSGGGKSMALSHVTAHALRNGQRVMYITLELPPELIEARIIANLTGCPINDITMGNHVAARAALARMQSRIGQCYTHALTPHAATVEDVKAVLKQYEDQRGFKPDLLVIDYADKLRAVQVKEGGSDYVAMRHVYEGLRLLAVERAMWCWSASQAKAKSRDMKRIDTEHAADSQHKVRVADLVISLNFNDETGEMEFFVAKHRTGESRKSVGPLPVDFALGRIAPVLDPLDFAV